MDLTSLIFLFLFFPIFLSLYLIAKPSLLAWGLIQGLAIAFESAGGGRWMKAWWQPFRHLNAVTIILWGWVFFRAPNLAYAFGFIGRLVGNRSGISPLPFSRTSPFPFIEPSFLIISKILKP
jgi:hypothetical protein